MVPLERSRGTIVLLMNLKTITPGAFNSKVVEVTPGLSMPSYPKVVTDVNA
jgi:hypothetical protein